MSESHIGGVSGDFTRGRRHTVATSQPHAHEDVDDDDAEEDDVDSDEGVDSALSGSDIDSDDDGAGAEQVRGRCELCVLLLFSDVYISAIPLDSVR